MAETIESSATDTVTVNSTAEKFEIAALREHCYELFKIQPFIFDGVFLLEKGPFTVEEAKGKIKTWLEKPITLETEV